MTTRIVVVLLLLVIGLGLLLAVTPGAPAPQPAKANREAASGPGWLAATAGALRPFGLVVAWALTGWLTLRLAANALKALLHAFLVDTDGRAMYPGALLRWLLPHVPENAPGSQQAAALSAGLVGVERIGHLGNRNSGGRPALPKAEALPELPAAAADLPAMLPVAGAPLAAGELRLPLGLTARGPLSLPLRNLGNGVVGGLQGTGKSECLASGLLGLLRQDAGGQRVQVAVADMKGGADFGNIPEDLAALWQPVAREPRQALDLMAGFMAEIERRNRIFGELRAANIEAANRAGANLPYLIGFFDEIAFLTMPATDRAQARGLRELSQAFVSNAVRVSMIGRAAGVALVMATQRPTSTVVPTMLRDLAGWRVAFRCANGDSSRAILDAAGAEDLPAQPGRCLIATGGAPELAQAYYAGIETGRFDAFLAGLPRRYGGMPGMAVLDAGQKAAELPVPPTVPALTAGAEPDDVPQPVPGWRIVPADSEEERMYQEWVATCPEDAKQRSLSAAVRARYGEDYKGGDGFETMRAAVVNCLGRRGKPIPWERKGGR